MSDRDACIATYLTLTKDVLPEMARDPGRGWPVRFDHCFQRIVLDAITGGVWYDHIKRPAYRHMTDMQAAEAAALAQCIASGAADLPVLNAQSLKWRAAAKAATPRQAKLDL